MKFLIVCLAIAGCASAALLPTYRNYPVQPAHSVHPVHPVQPSYHHQSADAVAPVLRSFSEIHPDGQYHYEYETGNGISAQEAGIAAKSVQGSFGYTAPDGTPIHLTYVADENGFHPVGAHLPVAPETPAHVLRSLEYIAAHPYKEEQQQYHINSNAGRYVQPTYPIIPVTAKPAYTPFRFHKF